MGLYESDMEKIKTRFRRIVTDIPHPDDVYSIDHSAEPTGMKPLYPMVWDKAYDFTVSDRHGNRWIDFTSGILVANCGHGNREICRAIQSCLNRPLLHSYLNMTGVRMQYIQALTQMAGFESAMLFSSGTEAVECAIRIVRRWSEINNVQSGVIYGLPGSFHGRTLGAMALSNEGLLPDIKPLKILTAEKPVGLFIETYEGWSGKFHDRQLIHQLVDITHKNGGLVVFDEMQAGFGRTGKFWGYEHYGIRPDLVCCGKGMSGSVPLSGVLGSKKILDLFSHGEMSSTHSANPISCSAGLATLKEIDRRDLVYQSWRMGRGMHVFLKILADRSVNITEVNGAGLMAGVVFQTKEQADAVCDYCFNNGLLVIKTGRESIKLAPPLTIHEDALIEGLTVFGEGVKNVRM